jgi:hypothetical protein
MLVRLKGVPGMVEVAVCVTGMEAPLPTMIEEEDDRRREEEKLPEPDAMWEVAPVSKYHSDAWGPLGGTLADASAASSACWFQTSPVGGGGDGWC